jgi:hypothetical protein
VNQIVITIVRDRQSGEVNSTISVVGGPPDVQFWEIVETLARMLANVARQVGGVVMASSGEREEAVGSK